MKRGHQAPPQLNRWTGGPLGNLRKWLQITSFQQMLAGGIRYNNKAATRK